jgi:hypothetical protein
MLFVVLTLLLIVYTAVINVVVYNIVLIVFLTKKALINN